MSNEKTAAVDMQQTVTGVPLERLQPGDRIGDYLVDAVIAEGGFGAVYATTHRVLGRRAAVKVLHRELVSSREMIVRFLREARITNQLRHPNIVDIYHFGETADGRPYFVMELLEGTSLRDLVRTRGRLTPHEVLAILEPVCSALAAAHAQGIVHRDIKSGNIHVPHDGQASKVKLLDFGIAKLLWPEPGETALTQTGQRMGTAHSCAPEQILSQSVDGRADVYALGVTLYFALVGAYPFPPGDLAQIDRFHLQTPFPRPSAATPVSSAVDEVVLKATQKAAADRFQDVGAFIDALRAAVQAPAPHTSALQRAPALGLYFEVKLPEAPDEAYLDQVAAVMDEVEKSLSSGGFRTPLLTGSSAVGVRLLPEDPRLATLVRAEAEALARQLHLAKEKLGGGAAVNVCLTLSQAECRVGADGVEVVGGAVLDTDRWAAREAGLHLYSHGVTAKIL